MESHGSQQFVQLNKLLEQTALYSEFLTEKIYTHFHTHTHQTTPETPPNNAKKRKTNASSHPNQHGQKAAAHANDLEHYIRTHNATHLHSLRELVPQGLEVRTYQLEGVDWLISLYENGLNGILGDEMGLGKTLQTILFFVHLWTHKIYGPFLIVAPLSTLHNWQHELSKWAPQMKSCIFHGTKLQRTELWRNLPTQMQNNPAMPVIITSFEVALAEKRRLQHIQWKILCVDEGHRLKNIDSKLLRELKLVPADGRLLLTGTPLQNSLRELWALLNFLLPTIFSDLARFESWFNIDDDIHTNEGREKIIENERQHQLVSKLHAVLRPFVLRRLKSEVLGKLPPKRQFLLYTPMSALQRRYYQAIIDKSMQKVLQKQGISLSNTLMQLRKTCNHPYLLHEPGVADQSEASNGFDDLLNAEQVEERCDNPNALIEDCGKLRLLDRLLKLLKQNGHRTLIFSQMTRMLDILEDFLILNNYERGVHYCRIDGSTKSDERMLQLNYFNDANSKATVFLLSTRAGGLGINLASADTVVIYDSDFNPQVDQQAMDRCHRYGQTKTVFVFRFLTPSSVEIKMFDRALSKRKLERIVMARGRFLKPDRVEKNSAEDVLQELMLVFKTNRVATALVDSDGKEECAFETLSSQSTAPNKQCVQQQRNILTPADVLDLDTLKLLIDPSSSPESLDRIDCSLAAANGSAFFMDITESAVFQDFLNSTTGQAGLVEETSADHDI